ncbi:PPOX class F420-dependent oxidoreductase [Kitasatospora sp. NPDC059811]|uniref:PPOX class F420-dependent oxidoreductase n=1 Tax=Streptomycetaceae TaxID=2062 RepID=UPI0007AFB24C|nr:PPOX class F420-dependent oxidoreductase [Streptomyces sp. MJM8645]
MPFTANEAAYLASQSLARLATVDGRGQPHVVPLGFHYNAGLGTIDVTGRGMARSLKYRHVQENPKVSLVVDDVLDPADWVVRGLEIRGTAQALPTGGKEVLPHVDDELIRITPERIVSWGIDSDCQAPPLARTVAKGARA